MRLCAKDEIFSSGKASSSSQGTSLLLLLAVKYSQTQFNYTCLHVIDSDAPHVTELMKFVPVSVQAQFVFAPSFHAERWDFIFPRLDSGTTAIIVCVVIICSVDC